MKKDWHEIKVHHQRYFRYYSVIAVNFELVVTPEEYREWLSEFYRLKAQKREETGRIIFTGVIADNRDTLEYLLNKRASILLRLKLHKTVLFEYDHSRFFARLTGVDSRAIFPSAPVGCSDYPVLVSKSWANYRLWGVLLSLFVTVFLFVCIAIPIWIASDEIEHWLLIIAITAGAAVFCFGLFLVIFFMACRSMNANKKHDDELVDRQLLSDGVVCSRRWPYCWALTRDYLVLGRHVFLLRDIRFVCHFLRSSGQSSSYALMIVTSDGVRKLVGFSGKKTYVNSLLVHLQYRLRIRVDDYQLLRGQFKFGWRPQLSPAFMAYLETYRQEALRFEEMN